MARATFDRATPVVMTGDYARARDFYCDKLGFELEEEGGDPPRFGIFRRGPAFIFVDGWKGPPPADNGTAWNAYFHVDSVSALVEDLAARGVEVDKGPTVTAYGMREVEVVDPDGNRLCFGSDVPPAV